MVSVTFSDAGLIAEGDPCLLRRQKRCSGAALVGGQIGVNRAHLIARFEIGGVQRLIRRREIPPGAKCHIALRDWIGTIRRLCHQRQRG
ncbi:hypothetical protein GALL_442280 [mine drainage metagenome]|uniref:Uncharacterized protein n=1 Tax=mine drainage metagenome TaxID=410659 RepID=A0A1J5Q9F9_9ZZZZ